MANVTRKSNRSSSKCQLKRAAASVRLGLSAVEPLESRLLFSAYVVNSNADAGAGTLRDAIAQANANPGADTISFALSSGQTSIALHSALPAISDALKIDGTTQPGFAGTPIVELNGSAAGTASGLLIHSSNVTVRGLVINRFALDGIDFNDVSATVDVSDVTFVDNFIGTDVTGSIALGNGGPGINLSISPNRLLLNAAVSGNVIAANAGAGLYLNNVVNSLFTGNVIGTDASGTLSVDANNVSFGNAGDGISFWGASSGNTVGGLTAAARNIISNNHANGVAMNGSASVPNLIAGNYIGTDITGTVAMGNRSDGFYGGSGGTTLNGNVISANGADGVDLGDDTTVINNLIGTDAAGTHDLGNAFDGVYIVGANNTIGLPGEGNVIAFNGAAGPDEGNGVSIVLWWSVGNSVRGNSIFSNSGMGIDLEWDGVTPNSNNPDDHVGPNNFQNYPVLATAAVTGGTATITGTFSANASSTYDLDFYATDLANISGHGEARTYLGSAQVTTDAFGNATFSKSFAGVPAGQFVFTTTATDSAGNTSEFSANAIAPSAAPSTSTTLSLNGSNFGFGQNVAGTITVAGAGASGVPSGVVQLFDGQTLLLNLTLDSNGSASFTKSDLPVGAHSLSVVYAGDSVFTGSSALASIHVGAGSTSTALSSTGPVHFGQAVLLTATVMPADLGSMIPSGLVMFYDGAAFLGSQSLNGSTATFSVNLSAGTHHITAVYGGDTNFAASSSLAMSQAVNAEATGTALSSNAPAVFGKAITFTAAVTFADAESTHPTGGVSFLEGGIVLGTASLDASGHAMVSLMLGVGSHSITAIYAGDGNFAASTSAASAAVVKPESTTLALTSSGSTSFGQSVTFSTQLSFPDAESIRPTGTITFMDGTIVLGTRSIDAAGRASFAITTLGVGSHTITASYNGDGNYTSSNSASASQSVGKATSSTTLATSSSTVNPGQAVTFTATLANAAGTGTVTFFDGTLSLGTVNVAAGKASFTTSSLSNGTHSIKAVYNGDSSFAGSTSATITQTVKRAAPSGTVTALSASSATVQVGSPLTFTATVTATSSAVPTGTVTFRDGSTVLGSASLVNGVATFTTTSLPLGGHSIVASYGGDVADVASTSSAVSVFLNVPAGGQLDSGTTPNPNFWGRTNGINLLLNFNGSFASTALGNWLAKSFPNLFGARSQYFNLTNASNLEVTLDYELGSFFAPKVWVDMLTTALDIYATTAGLGGATAAAYGFDVSTTGIAGATLNVGQSGSAFGLANNSRHTVLDLLLAANERSSNGQLFGGNNAARNQADALFVTLLQAAK